jgi:hypothetical protein
MSKRKNRKNKPTSGQQGTPNKPLAADSPGEGELHQHNPIDDKSNAENRKDQHEPLEESMSFVKTWWTFVKNPDHSSAVVAMFTIVIAFTGILYAVFSYLQWHTMSGQLDEMQGANRPYIVTIPPPFAAIPTPDFHKLDVTVSFVNVGSAPAVKVTNTVPLVAVEQDPGVSEQIEKCKFSYPPQQREHYLAPYGAMGVSQAATTVSSKFISDAERAFILDDKEDVVVLGGVKYSGVRGGDFETTYCYVWNPKSVSSNAFYPWSTCSCLRMK